MSIVSSQAVGRQATNNAFISKLSYATDLDYQNAQPAFLVNFPDTSRAHIYYNTTLKLFRYHDGTDWKNLNTNSVSSSPTSPLSPLISDLWFNTNDNSLNFWDGSAWVNISANSASNKAYVEATISPDGQSLAPIGSSVKINWNNIVSDTQSCFDPFTDEFVAPRNGKYLILAMLRTQQTSNGIGNLSSFSQIWKNGSSYLESGAFSQYSGSTGLLFGARLVSSTILDLMVGDKIDFRIFLPSYWTTPATINGISTLHRLTIIEL